MSPLTRRQLLAASAAGAVGAAAGKAAAVLPSPTSVALPKPNASGIDHIVFVCMENRSFDHYLGWLPGADGKQAGLSYPDDKGVLHPTHHLTEWQGCGFNDPDHSYEGGHLQLDGGRCDGFRKGANDDYALGYYTKDDLPLYSKLVGQATVFDHWFASILSSTYPNRFYTHAAQTDRIDNTMRTSALPTIWDRLTAAGVSANYYFNDLPFLALWGEKYVSLAHPYETFLAQAVSGTLPSFSYIDPFFLGEDQGGSNDDHPHADIRRGQAFVSEILAAVVNGPAWPNTAVVITYDEWGGFFDHVRPPKLADDHRWRPGEYDHSQAGFRVPGFVLSPYARRGHIDSGTMDHTSVLKFVEWRFGLKPLTARDRNARNIATALDFSKKDTSVPPLPVVPDPGPHLCGSPGVGMAAEEPFWVELRDFARSLPGWRQLM
ncbi:MAG TPA: alkaline phosphatase family protein [Mycobacteriales bacterium]|nr:alkaline phosphatase family protein [Mycobacteriales bacterium]